MYLANSTIFWHVAVVTGVRGSALRSLRSTDERELTSSTLLCRPAICLGLSRTFCVHEGWTYARNGRLTSDNCLLPLDPRSS